MNRGLRFAVSTLLAVLAWPAPVHAIDDSAKGAARDLANEAKRDFDRGNFEEATTQFQKAFEIAKVPTLAVWAARSLVKQGKLVAASELYRQATQLAPNELWVGNVQQQAEADAEKELGELLPRIARLRVRVEGALPKDIEVLIDDARLAESLVGLAIPTDPGRRRIVGRRGQEVEQQTIDLAEGERKETTLRFSLASPAAASPTKPEPAIPTPPALVQAEPKTTPVPAGVTAGGKGAPSTEGQRNLVTPQPAAAIGQSPKDLLSSSAQRTIGWVVLDVGLAGLFVGAATGVMVMTNGDLRRDCPRENCDLSKVDGNAVDNYNLMRNISSVGLIAGGICTAVGMTLLLTAPKKVQGPTLSLWVGASSAGVKGAF